MFILPRYLKTMKLYTSVLLLALAFSGCKHQEEGKIYSPRSLKEKENFNEFQKGAENALAIYSYTDKESSAENADKEIFGVKFRDTTVRIQVAASDKEAVSDHFALAEFLNTQKTAVLVQIADQSGLVAPFYLILLKDGGLDVVSVYRPSSGKGDQRFTKGLSRIGRSGYLINNDFFITTVDAKVYPLKRQNPEERIQGIHLLNSADKKTLVFLVSSSLYQVHYPTGEVYTQELSADLPKTPEQVFPWIQNNFSWQTNAKGISFLKKNKDDDRIIDIREFKKS